MLDDELPAGERAAVLMHLEGCAACRTRLAEYEEIRRLAALPAPAPPESLLSSFRLRLAREISHPADRDWTAIAEAQEQPFEGQS
jgi:anti-sigma factor RsiW